MSARLPVIVLAVVACILAGGAAGAPSPAEPTKSLPIKPDATAMAPLEFFLAHGPADACGPGCDEWIAAQGKIGPDAAIRLSSLLQKLDGRRPPIFFHSPGGAITGGLALGRLIREQKLTTSVARTVTPGCSRDKSGGDSCAARKHAGQPIEAAIDPTIAMCNSACVYALAGGAVRLVPPWVKLGIHDAGLDPSARAPSEPVFDAAMLTAHRRIRAFLHDMGISDALFPLILATPYKSVKPLQRDDLVRFGLDRREFGESDWEFVDQIKPQIRKLFFTATGDDQPKYVDGAVVMDCGYGLGTNVRLLRPRLGSDTVLTGAAPAALDFSAGGRAVAKPISMTRTGYAGAYVRWARAPPHAFDGVGDDAVMELPGSEFGHKDGTVRLAMTGFAAAYAKLGAACPDGGTHVALPQRAPGFAARASLPLSKFPAAAPFPALAQTAPPAPAAPPQTMEISRVAAAEDKLRLDFLYSIQPDCSSSGHTVVRVEQQPQHGTVTVEDGQAFTSFPRDNQRYDCNTRKSDGTLVFYQAKPDYRGPDTVTLYVIFPLGVGQTRHYSIEVK